MSFEHLVTSITSHLTSQIPKESTVILYNSSFSSLFDLYTRFKRAEFEGKNLPEKNFIVTSFGDMISVVMEYLGGSDINNMEEFHPVLLQSLNQVGIEFYFVSFACMLMAATSFGVIMTKSIYITKGHHVSKLLYAIFLLVSWFVILCIVRYILGSHRIEWHFNNFLSNG